MLQILLMLQMTFDPYTSYQLLRGYWFMQIGQYDSAAVTFRRYGLSYDLAELYIQMNQPDSAISVLREVIERDGETAEAMELLAKAYYLKNDRKRCLKTAVEILKKFPDSMEAVRTASRILANFEKFGLALSGYRRVMALGDRSDSVLTEIASVFFNLDQTDSALAYYRTAYRINPHSQDAIFGLAWCFDRLGLKDSALFYFLKLEIQDSYGDPIVEKRISDLLIGLGRYDEALKMLSALKSLYPMDFYIRLNLCYLWLKKDSLERGLDEALSAVALKPEDPEGYFFAAQAAYRLKLFNKALEFATKAAKMGGKGEKRYLYFLSFLNFTLGNYKEAYEAAKKVKHKDSDVYWVMGKASLMMGDTTKALKFMRKAVSDTSAHLAMFETLVNLLEELGKRETADSILRIALKRYPDSVDVWLTYATFHYDDDFEAADSAFARAHELEPNNALILNNWGYLLAKHGVRLDEAKEMLQKALEAEPENPYYLDSMGWIYYQMGDFRTALEYLLHALALKNDDPDICEHLGFTYRMLGDITRAKKFWKKALELDPERKHLAELLKQFGGN